MAQLTLTTIGATIILLGVGHAFPGPAHYALAGGVGLATLVLCALAFRRARDRSVRGPAVVALVLVLA